MREPFESPTTAPPVWHTALCFGGPLDGRNYTGSATWFRGPPTYRLEQIATPFWSSPAWVAAGYPIESVIDRMDAAYWSDEDTHRTVAALREAQMRSIAHRDE